MPRRDEELPELDVDGEAHTRYAMEAVFGATRSEIAANERATHSCAAATRSSNHGFGAR